MDPNSSLLRMFDPIQGIQTTPSHQSRPHDDNDEALTMSTFFNRINQQPTALPAPFNRSSLIDLSFQDPTLSTITCAVDTTPTKAEPTMPKSHLKCETSPTDGSDEGSTPKMTRSRNIFAPDDSVLEENPRPKKAIATSRRPPPSPSKHSHHLTASPESRPRCSSLDVTALTLNIKDRLKDMSFDLINDEISLLSELTEGDPTPAIPRASSRKETPLHTAPLNVTKFVIPPLDPETVNKKLALPAISSTMLATSMTLPSLPKFEFEEVNLLAPMRLEGGETDSEEQSSRYISRKPRKSVFDALENSPNSSAKEALPNIVTSWETDSSLPKSMLPPSELKVPTVPRVNRHVRTVSSASAASVGSRTFKVPVLPGSTRSKVPLPSVIGSPEPPRVERVKSSRETKSRRQLPIELSPRDEESEKELFSARKRETDVESRKDLPVSVGAVLRRTKTTISSAKATFTAPSDSVKTRPSSSLAYRAGEARGIPIIALSSRATASRPASRTSILPSASGTHRSLSRSTSVQVLPSRKTVPDKPAPSASSGHVRTSSKAGVLAAVSQRRNVEPSVDRVANNAKEKERGLREWASGVASATEAARKIQKENARLTDIDGQVKKRTVREHADAISSQVSSSRTKFAPVETLASIPPSTLRSRPSLYGMRPASASVTDISKIAAAPSAPLRTRTSVYSIRSGIASASSLIEPPTVSKSTLPSLRATTRPLNVASSVTAQPEKPLSRTSSSLLRSKSRTLLPLRPAREA